MKIRVIRVIRGLILIATFALALAAPAANRAYCRPTNGGRSLAYAPEMLAPVLTPPTAAEYAARGWLKNAVTPPTPPDGYVCTNTTYEAQGGAVVAVYAYGPEPTVPDRYSVPDLFFWLRAYDEEHPDAPKGQAVKEWLDAANLYTIAVTTRVVSADNELFTPTLAAIKAAVGFTDEEIAAALAYAKTDATPDSED